MKLIANCRLAGITGPQDLLLDGGRVAAIGPSIGVPEQAEIIDAGGALAMPGLVESHIHLDKAMILDRCPICEGTLGEAVRLTAAAKAGFTVADVHARAAALVRQAILHGTNRLRTFVEVDPRAGFRSFEAILALKADFAAAIDIEICAFAQEGLIKEPQTGAMLREALRQGADLVGGCPYTDSDPVAHVHAIFDIAEAFGVRVDFHADFDLDPTGSILPEIIAETARRGFGGRVSVGHVTKLAAMIPAEVDRLGAGLAEAGVAVTVLPATDLFLAPQWGPQAAPRGLAPAMRLRQLGVVTSLASNNVLNPFTPYGDASLIRMGNLFANIAQLASDADLEAAFAMIGRDAARLLGVPHELEVGGPATLILVDAPDGASAIRRIAPVLAGWKAGRPTFRRDRPELLMDLG
jgi:cytosine deaminase